MPFPDFTNPKIVSIANAFAVGMNRDTIESDLKLDCSDFDANDEDDLFALGKLSTMVDAMKSRQLLDALVVQGFTREEAVLIVAHKRN